MPRIEPSTPPSPGEPVAIVGMACRFPGGLETPDAFWTALLESRDLVGEVPPDRWHGPSHEAKDPSATGRIVSRRGAFLESIEGFDAAFFGISPREALRMDPQQRMFLELAWEALEDARLPPPRLAGSSTGVFIGLSANDYGRLQQDYVERIDGYTNLGNTLSIASNRISHQFDLRGPSFTVDTACSSGLVAVVLACRSLWSGESTAALAGASNLILVPGNSVGFSKAGMLSPTGICHAFDARADGYVRGEGLGMVFLKPLSRALADGDRIHATIVAAAMNQDGRTSSLPVPSPEAQRRLTESCLAAAGVEPDRVVYVEAHGTGTPVGDPIEARAVGEALFRGRVPGRPCLLGSVKTNLGHLETASGLAGLIKTALVLREGLVPPNLHFSTPNPHIPFADLGLEVVTEPTPLPSPPAGAPLAAVNSFGFGGANAQVLLTPAPRGPFPAEPIPAEPIPAEPASGPPLSRNPSRPLVLILSAASPVALTEMARRYHSLLERDPEPAAALCAAAARGRSRLSRGLAIIGQDAAALTERLSAWLENPAPGPGLLPLQGVPNPRSERVKPVFVFTGQGVQRPGMGKRLLETEPVFRRTVEAVERHLRPLTGWSLIEELSREEAESAIHRTEVAQPALFAVQAGLADLWHSWGIEPAAVTGHSVGEVAAAYAAGIFTLEEASELVFHRSRLQASVREGGRMAAVALGEADLAEVLADAGGAIEIAAHNSPNLLTLAGDGGAMASLVSRLEQEGRFVRWLPVDYAFHSRRMDPIRNELLAALAPLRPRPGTIPFFSTVSGDRLAGESLDAAYWWRNVREAVQFAGAVENLAGAGATVFLEIGPHPALSPSIHDCLSARRDGSVRVSHSLRRDTDEAGSLAESLASLDFAGVSADWEVYLGAGADRSPPLPLYPWDRTSYWNESPRGRRRRTGIPSHPLLGLPTEDPVPGWEVLLDPKAFPWLEDHRFWKRTVFPAAAYVAVAMAAARELGRGGPLSLEDFSFEALFVLSHESPPTLRVELEDSEGRVSLQSRVAEATRWTRHARGRVVPRTGEIPARIDLDSLRERLPEHLAHWDFYEQFRSAGYDYGETFRLLEQVWFGEAGSLAEVRVPDELPDDSPEKTLHPALLDAAFHAVLAAIAPFLPGDRSPRLFLPASMGRYLEFGARPPRHFWVRVQVREASPEGALADLDLCDATGLVFASIRAFEFRALGLGAERRPGEDCFYQLAWEESPPAENPPDPAGRRFLLLSDRAGLASALSAELTQRGASVVVDESWRESEWIPAIQGGEELVHLGLLDLLPSEDSGVEILKVSNTSELAFLKRIAIYFHSIYLTPKLRTIVRELGSGSESGIFPPPVATLPGFLRVAATEIPGSFWGSILLGSEPRPEDAAILAEELLRADGESEVVCRREGRLVRRIRPVRLDDLPRRLRPASPEVGERRPYALETERPGSLDRLVLNEIHPVSPGPGEVLVRVAAAGVNFRDLMKLLGMYPGSSAEREHLGDDFAGIVLSVGDGVTDLRPGDRVAGFGAGSFRSHLAVDRRLCFALPASLSFPEAASLPTVFLTAHHALSRLARLRPGESVLIHAAAGGVGLAAVQVARSLGLVVYATAGSPEKRDLLRSLGVERVMDSRTLAFADEILESTGGRGVDAVLNSLSGEFLVKSLAVLAPFGRFLEIGKVDLFSDRPLRMRALRRNITFHVVDLAALLEDHPAEAEALFREVCGAFAAGTYRPVPTTLFPAAEAAAAFRLMARGEHRGKLVLDFSDDSPPTGPVSRPGALFPVDRSWLIAGGASGFGFETAKWLAANGARHLALLSRTGPADETVRAGIAALEATGVRVLDLRGDVTDPAAVEEAVGRTERELSPLAGVVHAAMVIEDRFLPEHDTASFEKALLPKMLGAWNLHHATRHRKLDYFLCHSSVSGVLGTARQANYAAGNSFLDEFARYRRSLGLPALSVSWGALAGAGYAARNPKTLEFLERSGASAFTVAEALDLLGPMLRRDSPHLVAARIDWALLSRLSAPVGRLPLYREVAAGRGLGGAALRPLLQVVPPEERRRILEDFIAANLAAVSGAEEGSLDRSVPVSQLGLDSLMAVEMLNRIEDQLGIDFPMGAILGGPSIRDLTETLLQAFDASLENAEPGGERTEEAG